MGFCALAGTGKLDPLSLILVSFALLLRGYHLYKGKTVLIAERWTTYLTLTYFFFYAVDYFVLSQGFISATVHMVLFIMVIKIFSAQRNRDQLYLAVLSFLMVLAAAVLTVDTMYIFTFCFFMLAAMSTFVSMEMRRSERESRIITVLPRNQAKFSRSLYGVAGLLSLFTLAGAGVIFFILPRLNMGGYLQSLGGQTDFVSGFSETVSLGGIGRIQQSDSPIMHVQVTSGAYPADAKWRGVALANFDGRRWSNPSHEIVALEHLRNVSLDLRLLRTVNGQPLFSIARQPTFGYRVVMEPVGSYIFFLASAPLTIKGPYSEVGVSSGGSITKIDGGRTIDIYEGEADTTDPARLVRDSRSQNYPPIIARDYLQLPSHLDSRIMSLARTIAASAQSSYDRAAAIERYLRQNLSYTLDLPGQESDPLANFLFTRKRGHCEYFASAMTIMLRTLGQPARVVNGFRGGEYNDVSHTYVIRGRDAHSWVEAYFPEYGWVAFDPTPALPADTETWSRFRMYMDAMHQMWREWVINYDFSRQVRLSSELTSSASGMQSRLRSWFWLKYTHVSNRIRNMRGAIGYGNLILICVLGMIVIALPFTPRAWRALRRARMLKNPGQSPSSSASLWYARMLKVLARRGIRKTPNQTPEEFAAAIVDPEMHKDVVVFTEHYERARFANSADDAMRLPELYEELKASK